MGKIVYCRSYTSFEDGQYEFHLQIAPCQNYHFYKPELHPRVAACLDFQQQHYCIPQKHQLLILAD